MIRSKFSTEPNRTEPPKKHRTTEPNRTEPNFRSLPDIGESVYLTNGSILGVSGCLETVPVRAGPCPEARVSATFQQLLLYHHTHRIVNLEIVNGG